MCALKWPLCTSLLVYGLSKHMWWALASFLDFGAASHKVLFLRFQALCPLSRAVPYALPVVSLCTAFLFPGSQMSLWWIDCESSNSRELLPVL